MLYGSKSLKKFYLFVFCIFVLLSIELIRHSFSSVDLKHLHQHDEIGYHLQNSVREKNDKVISSLNHQVEDLKHLLKIKTNQLERVKKLNSEIDANVEISENLMDVFQDGDSILHFVNEKVRKSEVLNGVSLKNENEVNHFTFFDSHNIFQLNTEFNNKPREVWLHRRELRLELFEIIAEGVRSLNDDPQRRDVSPTYRFTDKDFMHGLYRTEKGIGTHYELVYRPRSSTNIVNGKQLFRVTLFRPFAPLRKIQVSALVETETIHFIVPLSGRADTFRVFINYFKDDALPDKNVHLTVVYYGSEELSDVEEILHSLESGTGFKNYKLITENDEFSRGKALQRGADSLDFSKNPLMFFCDVDLAFTLDFLNQCRAYTSPGKLVFFPIVFSLFNPSIVFEKSNIPSLQERRNIKKNTGFWRDFGFGMSCQYLSDFRQTGGFDLDIKGWGTEDLRLYRKYTKTSLRIVRTPVNSLFHHWHPKFCDKNWSAEQYESCLKSRIRNEGSVLQLGAKYYELKEKLES